MIVITPAIGICDRSSGRCTSRAMLTSSVRRRGTDLANGLARADARRIQETTGCGKIAKVADLLVAFRKPTERRP